MIVNLDLGQINQHFKELTILKSDIYRKQDLTE